MSARVARPAASRFCIFLLLLVLACVFDLFAGRETLAQAQKQSQIQVLTPPTGATVIGRHPETHLVLRSSSQRAVRIQIADTNRLIEPVLSMEGEDGQYHHYRIPLKAGNNTFILTPGGERVTLDYLPITSELNLKPRGRKIYAFHQDDKLPASCQSCHDLQDHGTVAPVGLPKQQSCASCHGNLIKRGNWKHSTTVNNQCLACHQQSVKPWRIGMPSVPIRNLCLGCHTGKKAWFEKKVLHAPINLGGCTLCHDPHGGASRGQLWADGARDLCVSCHSNMAQLVAASGKKKIPQVHNVIAGPGCVVCHDPHATDQIFMLHQPINTLCSGCHPEIASSGGHPVPGHRVAGPQERLRPGRQLSCTSCHEPHGSFNRPLLIETSLGGRLCRECHPR